jgi:hypothetical protein
MQIGRGALYGPGPGTQGPTKLIIGSKYLKKLFDAVIITIVGSIQSTNLKQMFDAIIIKMLIKVVVYI